MDNLVCKNISKSYGSVTALRNVSMQVARGEVRALFGGNGSGKSTLAKIIGGFVKPSSGELFVGGEKVSFHSPSDAKKKRIIITAQELSLFPNLSVEENLMICSIPKHFGCIDRKEIKAQASRVLEKVGIPEALDMKIDSLSINQKYMVELAKALAQRPDILILDEITSALYREEVEVVGHVINELKKSGCSIIFVSHRMPEIYALCDTITVLRSGNLIGTYKVAEKTKNELLSLMTGTAIDFSADEKTEYDIKGRKKMLHVEDMRLLSKGSVNLDVYEGEVIGVAGLQGNGQSELVRALYAVDTPISLELYGSYCTIKNPRAAVKKGMAFISGERELEGTFATRSISENMSSVSDLVLNKPLSGEEKLAILDEYNVVMDSPKQKLQNLSGGNQQKVVMARWTATNPRIILADDPTKGIDVSARHDVHKLMRKLAQNGSSVIFVSSDDEELVELTRSVPCAKVIVMYDGSIVATLHGEDITTEKIAAYEMPKENGVPDNA